MSRGALHKLGIFGTPLFLFDAVESPGRDELVTRLLEEWGQSPGITRYNVGGWHSKPDLAQRPELVYQTLLQALVDRVSACIGMLAEEGGQALPDQLRYDVQAWATVMREGNYVTPHDHGEAHWSVVHFLDAGDIDVAGHPDSGHLTLIDPRRGMRPMPRIELFPQRFTIKPRSGALVVFPAYLQHFVHPYRGQKPRVAISATLTVLP